MNITFEFDDLSGSFEDGENQKILLKAKDTLNLTEGSKEVTLEEMAAILYSMHDVQMEDPYKVASEALKDFPVELIP